MITPRRISIEELQDRLDEIIDELKASGDLLLVTEDGEARWLVQGIQEKQKGQDSTESWPC